MFAGKNSSKSRIRIAVLQINPTVGDLTGNRRRVEEALAWAEGQRADLAVTPELVLTGYPPEDLLLRPYFLEQAQRELNRLARKTGRTALVCGHPSMLASAGRGGGAGRGCYNSATILQQRKALASYHKMALPNYGVFDELRYFQAGSAPLVLQSVRGNRTLRIALSICEDLWPSAMTAYLAGLRGVRPDVILNLSASPYEISKPATRVRVFSEAAKRSGSAVVCVNLVGGQDELLFDGRSLVIDSRGKLIAEAKAFAEDRFCVDLPLESAPDPSFLSVSGVSESKTPTTVGLTLRETPGGRSGRSQPFKAQRSAGTAKHGRSTRPGTPRDVVAALEFSLQEYVRKNGFERVGVAMSGGIDSALVAALAVRALGKNRVIGATLPSRITSSDTLRDARAQAKLLGIRFYEMPIHEVQSQFMRLLAPVFCGSPAHAAEENLQARIRGTLMMALSNHLGFLLLATGNKSELATGYCTLYGDMAGGFAPLKDLSKTWVYQIAKEINRLGTTPLIPRSVLRRAPTAELRPNQKDQDTLPPYSRLDRILEHLIEGNLASANLLRLRKGHRAAEVQDTVRRLRQNEYKRRQAPPGPKLTMRAFGRDWRMPISRAGAVEF